MLTIPGVYDMDNNHVLGLFQARTSAKDSGVKKKLEIVATTRNVEIDINGEKFNPRFKVNEKGTLGLEGVPAPYGCAWGSDRFFIVLYMLQQHPEYQEILKEAIEAARAQKAA